MGSVTGDHVAGGIVNDVEKRRCGAGEAQNGECTA